MPRSPRLQAANLFYHVYSRGNNKEQIYLEASNYQRFTSNLERFRTSLYFKIYAYCLMPNHFHLFLQTGKVTLSKIMQILMTAYAMYINKKYARVGHVFQGRFQSIVVEKETYFLQVQRYIHLNPVIARIVNDPINYPWSSYKAFVTNNFDQLPKVETAEVLSHFSSNLSKQKELYKEFTLDGIDNEFDPFKHQWRGVLGGIQFSQKLTKVLKGVRP